MKVQTIITRGLLLLVVVGVISCKKKVSGDGPVVTQERSVGDFNRLRVQLDAVTYVTQESGKKVVIEAQQNILDVIETPVLDGQLRIRIKEDKRLGSHNPIVVRISNSVLNGLEVDGSGDLVVTSALQASDLYLEVSGSGSVKAGELTVAGRLSANISGSGGILALGGFAENGEFKISGSGWIDLLPVKVKRVDANISGSGDIRTSVRDLLEGKISGSGSILYQGSPAVNTKISGSGSVRKL